jgi:hypothetical protein
MPTQFVPWFFLDYDEPKTNDQTVPSPKPNPKQHKTFAQASNNVCDIPLSQLPKPCLKGDRLAINIPEEEYEARMNTCKHNLHGRVIRVKGATPLTVVALKSKLATLWKSIGRFDITSIGKGFFEFTFSSLEDVRRVRLVNSWDLNPGFLKHFTWSHDFNLSLQKQTSAQVW